MFGVSSGVGRPAGAAGLSAPRVPACSGGPAGGRGRLPSPADDNHQGFASVNRAPEPAGGGNPAWLPSTARAKGSEAPGGAARQKRGRPCGAESGRGPVWPGQSPGGAGAAPGASNRGQRGPHRGRCRGRRALPSGDRRRARSERHRRPGTGEKRRGEERRQR